MNMAILIILFLVTVAKSLSRRSKKAVEPFGDEARLLQMLLRGYVKATRPVANASHTITVKVNFALTQILDVDEKNQVLTMNVWFSQEWFDEKLSWKPNEYNNLDKLRIPPDLIWRPDVVLYNGVDDYGDKVYSQCLAMVSSDGSVFWAPIANLRSTCKLDLTFFPFDDQVCHFKVGSWTYDGFQVDLTNKSEKMDLEQYTRNGGWDLIATKTRRNVVYYPCCPEPFPDVTFTIYLRRRTLYYILNVVIPCLLLSGLSVLGFWLPVGTSEKVSLGLTVLLAFFVLGLSIADRIPETSEFVPLIGVYLTVIMILTSISVALCVFILHLHRLGDSPVRVPNWLHKLTTRYLARLVGMSYIVKHRKREILVTTARARAASATGHITAEETHPLNVDTNEVTFPYKLIQVEGNGLYILAKDTDILAQKDNIGLNDLHRFSGQGQTLTEQGQMLDAIKAMFEAKQAEVNDEPMNSSDWAPGTRIHELLWHDIAEIIDRFFFWLCFFTVTMSTLCILVILPLSKPDPLTIDR